jgi:protein SCO1
MKRNPLRRFGAQLAAIGLLGLVAAGFSASMADAQGLQRDIGQSALTATPDIRFDQRVNNQIPLDCTFRDETGKTVALKNYFHAKKPVILVMPFFKCMSGCTLELKGMAAAFNQMNYKVGDDFEVLTVSINPKEGPDIAAKQKTVYLQMYHGKGGAAGWHFLTGTHDNIRALATSVGFKYVENLDTEQFGHATGIVVLTPDGKAYRYFYGSEYSPRELRMALNEASNNNLGTVFEQLLQLCYHYDPTTGHYGLVIQRVLVGAGMATVFILASSIMLMLRWEKKYPRSMPPSQSGESAPLHVGLQGDTPHQA